MNHFAPTSGFLTNPRATLIPPNPTPHAFSPAQLVHLSPPADGGELPPGVEQRSGQLVFTKVTRSDAGDYMCVASNGLQGEIRAVVTLTVAGESHYLGACEWNDPHNRTPSLSSPPHPSRSDSSSSPQPKSLVVNVHLRVFFFTRRERRLFSIHCALLAPFIAR